MKKSELTKLIKEIINSENWMDSNNFNYDDSNKISEDEISLKIQGVIGEFLEDLESIFDNIFEIYSIDYQQKFEIIEFWEKNYPHIFEAWNNK